MRLSVSQAVKAKDYKVVEDKALGSWPSANQITVQDLTDNSYWCTVYAVGEDDADVDSVKEWRKARKITIETYESIR